MFVNSTGRLVMASETLIVEGPSKNIGSLIPEDLQSIGAHVPTLTSTAQIQPPTASDKPLTRSQGWRIVGEEPVVVAAFSKARYFS